MGDSSPQSSRSKKGPICNRATWPANPERQNAPWSSDIHPAQSEYAVHYRVVYYVLQGGGGIPRLTQAV
ncbi:hypothetical protein Pan258_48940 [Symmachiella dynata]|nr:hypothetical protein Pan258_48940 [Symmachiella dynata]